MASFLLVGGQADSLWSLTLAKALAPFGSLRVMPEGEWPTERYDVIIVDATAVQDVAAIVGRLRNEQPAARIVVVTASPTWQRAREAFHSGAVEYTRKSLNEDELRGFFQNILCAQ